MELEMANGVENSTSDDACCYDIRLYGIWKIAMHFPQESLATSGLHRTRKPLKVLR